ncbi:hypothetical protein NliqN6_0633 [Naganishia liquefaciens]|uniref:Uncharacterized protein n=1 Tax=Naganishia liquefaciens TaxID=104408 RepID=A0A8H3TNX7_9TREE|nr:hypothetical protein NliqN6_0633 [Naganishia liquefaciens]
MKPISFGSSLLIWLLVTAYATIPVIAESQNHPHTLGARIFYPEIHLLPGTYSSKTTADLTALLPKTTFTNIPKLGGNVDEPNLDGPRIVFGDTFVQAIKGSSVDLRTYESGEWEISVNRLSYVQWFDQTKYRELITSMHLDKVAVVRGNSSVALLDPSLETTGEAAKKWSSLLLPAGAYIRYYDRSRPASTSSAPGSLLIRDSIENKAHLSRDIAGQGWNLDLDSLAWTIGSDACHPACSASLRAFLAAAQKGSADRLARSVSQVISDRLASLVHYSVSTRRQAQGDVMMVQREMEDAEGSLEIAKHPVTVFTVLARRPTLVNVLLAGPVHPTYPRSPLYVLSAESDGTSTCSLATVLPARWVQGPCVASGPAATCVEGQYWDGSTCSLHVLVLVPVIASSVPVRGQNFLMYAYLMTLLPVTAIHRMLTSLDHTSSIRPREDAILVQEVVLLAIFQISLSLRKDRICVVLLVKRDGCLKMALASKHAGGEGIFRAEVRQSMVLARTVTEHNAPNA